MSDFITVIGNMRRIRCVCGAIPELAGYHEQDSRHDIFPQADVKIKNGIAHIYADLPGVDPENISIYVYGQIIVIEGVKPRPIHSGEYRYLRLERHFSSFKRVFKFPLEIVRYEAVIDNGVLHVALAAD